MAKTNKYLDEEAVVENTVTEEVVAEEEAPVVEAEPEPVKKPRSSKKAPKHGRVYNCGFLNVRENPSTAAKVIKYLSAGSEIDILGEEGDFYKIADGFVMKSYIEV